MNQRIYDLAGQAKFMAEEELNRKISYNAELKAFAEKLAELIVRECCGVLEQTEDALDRQKWPTPRGCVEYIKDHFGDES
jgi:hypothetical protein